MMSVLHQFSAANTGFLNPRATLTSWVLLNVGCVLIYTVERSRTHCTDTFTGLNS